MPLENSFVLSVNPVLNSKYERKKRIICLYRIHLHLPLAPAHQKRTEGLVIYNYKIFGTTNNQISSSASLVFGRISLVSA